jgi:hypothetical protein
VAILNLPATAKITQTRECKIKAVEFHRYTCRTSFAPLAKVSVVVDELGQNDLDALAAQLITAASSESVQMPYISTENYLVQSFKIRPIIYQINGSIEFTMVEQRKSSVAEDRRLVTIPYSPMEGSFKEEAFRVWSLQYESGLQKTKKKSQVKVSETIWDVTFWLNDAQATELDQQLIKKRGIYPFVWVPKGTPTNNDTWLCPKWSIEFAYANFRIFRAQLLYDGRPAPQPSIEIITITGNPSVLIEGTIIEKISITASSIFLIEGGGLLVSVAASSISIQEQNILAIVNISASNLAVIEENNAVISIAASPLILIEGT